MVFIDTSAWVEFLNNTGHQVVRDIELALDNELICLGDLVYFEVLQGIQNKRQLAHVKRLFGTLQREPVGGFEICEKAAENYKLLRSFGVTVRKTIDVIIGTFCLEKGHAIIHNDRDFKHMEEHLGLKVFEPN